MQTRCPLLLGQESGHMQGEEHTFDPIIHDRADVVPTTAPFGRNGLPAPSGFFVRASPGSTEPVDESLVFRYCSARSGSGSAGASVSSPSPSPSPSPSASTSAAASGSSASASSS